MSDCGIISFKKSGGSIHEFMNRFYTFTINNYYEGQQEYLPEAV